MMNTFRKLLKKETGQVLPMALILLVLGGLLIVPMLSLMTTNLTANRIVEEENLGIYAADAGIQDALWKLGQGIEPFSDNSSHYVLSETINDMTVTVEELEMDVGPYGYLYTIKATATRNSENVTSIIAQAHAGASFHWLFKNVLTSANDVELGSNTVVIGDIVAGGSCTGDTDNVYGDITEGAEILMPSEGLLTAFYLSTFDDEVRANGDNFHPDDPYTSAVYEIPPGHTYDNPYEIPWLYCTAGKLSIVADSDTYAKLTGNIFLAGPNGNDGKFDLSDKDVTLDLNNYTIYATFSDYDDCAENAIYFGPGTYVNGPGCIIGVGNVDFQPSASQGERLIGTETHAEETTITESQDKFVLSKFYCKSAPPEPLSSIQVKCHIDDPEAPPAHLKVALYEDDNGSPGSLMNEAESDNITISSWAVIDFPPTQLEWKNYYWMAAIADADIICTQTPSDIESKISESTHYFDTFEFPDLATSITLLEVPETEYMMRGFTGSQQFFFLMSVECTVNVQPGGSFYGSIAGNANVKLQPDCFINLVDTPEGGLNFPGSGIVGTSGDAPPLVNYNIQ